MRRSLAFRITALCLAVAGVAVLVAGLVAAGLVRRAGQDVLRTSLAAQADVVASQVDEAGLGSRLGLPKVADVLRGQGISIVVVRPRGVLPGNDAAAARAAMEAGLSGITAGQVISASRTVAGQQYLVEARGVGTGVGFALVAPVQTGRAAQRTLVRDILLSLGAGLLVAAAAGLLLGRLLARPLRRTADVAATMRQGRRDLRVPVEGPAEVAEVATAVNELAVALQQSEARQREFLLSVSHELRTPLTAVHGFAESLADGVVSGEEARRAGETIRQESGRLERLVSDLLDLARLGADEFRLDLAEVDLTDTVRHCAQVWRTRCERAGVDFHVELPPEPVFAVADARRLRQVLDGLAENALRVTPAGAPLTLSLSGAGVLQVRDGGPGLAPEDYAVAFERGTLNAKYRGRRPVGSGIGLALAHGLVTRMGGTISAGPAPEGGAAFTIALPPAGGRPTLGS
ncbi:signal transduction histidine kinase [Amycolatopsis bartoniae]|uniref:Signal transduction histidine-protein kinase/phosphatase MprB n=1 Tax=Amycolatopsis bartoniae TaxID=941986 RepID=A0A8H9M9D4_9PSEU|nr:HAMP domain-containing sensor histidine kinase [Amycolatopsis bartoniae]MBB2934312.1 signal transduction histidine kinase [Amycolatopsis bartoniae]TVT00131.1 HAMP domain-containing histidine kinase [Amycolatopsis bartoniae]GHF48271.1 two-component sensor histidine kinase [Amycolatopsis bartoniae]